MQVEMVMENHLLNLIHSSFHLRQLKQVHTVIIKQHLVLAPVFIHALIAKFYRAYAHKVFDRIPVPLQLNAHSYMITAYSRTNMNKEALEVFSLMHRSNRRLVSFVVPPVLKSCSILFDIMLGKQVHGLIVHCGFDSNVFVPTALVDLYAKNDDLGSAELVFDGIPIKDSVCYNCLISGYSKKGNVLAARKLFDDMEDRTIVSWNSMLSCYSHNGDYHEGLKIFEQMQADGFKPNEVTVVTALSICAKLGDLNMGLKVKKLIDEKNFHLNVKVLTALLEMYVKCGAVDEARRDFDRMNQRDTVTWGTMIAGYAQNGMPNEALELFAQMKIEQMNPNDVTIVSVLSACSQLGLVGFEDDIGEFVERLGFTSNVYVASALIDMYSKTGNIRKARELFGRMQHKDIVVWNSMILGLAFNSLTQDALALYEEMLVSEVKPDDITFVGLLTACTHGGLLAAGLELFRRMRSEHNLLPKVEHCACVVDLFCRAGKLGDAHAFICNMEMEPNAVIWGTLLSASRTYANVKIAELAAKKLLQLEPENSGNFVLLSSMFANVGRWQESIRVRDTMLKNKVQKTFAYSWIELENTVHKFLVCDKSHPKSDELCSIIDGLSMQSAWAVQYADHETVF